MEGKKELTEGQLNQIIEMLKEHSRLIAYSNKPLCYLQKVTKLIRELRKLQNNE